jgi:hypothetical protein
MVDRHCALASRIADGLLTAGYEVLNRVLLENYSLPSDLERQIEPFIKHYNHLRTLHSPRHG